MAHKTLIGGTAYALKGGRDLIGGTGYSIKSGKALIGGTAYDIQFSVKVPLNTVEPGAILYLNESGSPVPFYIAKHDYESAANGTGRTLLVRKDCYDLRGFNSVSNGTYLNSALDTWLDGTYPNLLDSSVKTLLGKTTIQFRSSADAGGSPGVYQRTAFQLSTTELGGTQAKSPEGSVLPIADMLHIAYLNGTACAQWTRSVSGYYNPRVDAYIYNYIAWTASGTEGGGTIGAQLGSRPAFTLPGTLEVIQQSDGSYTVAA